MKIDSGAAELRAVMAAADLMLAAARTAPKACGSDHLEAFALTGEEKDRLAESMRTYGREKQIDFIVRDAGNVDASPVLLLLGVVNDPMLIADCGMCGFKNCGACMKNGGNCAFNITDLGIAVGSAVSVAADHRIDNRVIYSAGRVAVETGLFSEKVRVAYGIPLSVSSKSPFFDRDSGDNKCIERPKK